MQRLQNENLQKQGGRVVCSPGFTEAGACSYYLGRLEVSVLVTFFEHRDGNRALRKKEGLGRPNILEITERNNRWMFVPKLVIFR